MADKDNDRLLEHAYDGIQEYDNPLPTWWKLIFYATILVVPLYLWDPLGIGVGPGRETVYKQEMADFSAAHPANAGPVLGDAQFLAMSKDPAKVAAGKAVFTTTCAPCHRADAGGLIGPNLTDDFWIHGGQPKDILTTIVNGVPDKGMLTWGPILGPEKCAEVAAYVYTLHGKHPATPKEPQGTKVTYDAGGPVAPAASGTPTTK